MPSFVCKRWDGDASPALTEPNESCSIGLDGIYHYQTEGNEHKRESCLVEFFPAYENKSIVYENWAGVDICTIWTVDGGVNRWCTLASRTGELAKCLPGNRVCSQAATLKYLVAAND